MRKVQLTSGTPTWVPREVVPRMVMATADSRLAAMHGKVRAGLAVVAAVSAVAGEWLAVEEDARLCLKSGHSGVLLTPCCIKLSRCRDYQTHPRGRRGRTSR